MKFLIILLCLTACSPHAIYLTNDAEKSSKHGQFPTTKTTHFVCSFYADKFHGRTTSNGETFDMYKFTAAHKTLPFNTKLRVINEDNGKSVVVRINDRGPFIKGRDLDLSFAAAQKIGLIPYGVKRLKIEFLKEK